MNRIVAPLGLEHWGPSVVNLQDGLRRLIDMRVIEVDDQRQQELATETQERRYGGATLEIVSVFQESQGLERTGSVDEETAKALNIALEQIGGFAESDDSGWTEVLGALQVQSQTLQAIDADTNHLGQIDAKLDRLADAPTQREIARNTANLAQIDAKLDAVRKGTDVLSSVDAKLNDVRSGTGHLTSINQNIASLASENMILALGARGDAVRDVQGKLKDVGYWVPDKEAAEATFGAGTRDALLQLQDQYNLARTGVLDDASRNALAIAVGIAKSLNRIEGRIVLDNGLPATSMTLRIVNKGFGDQVTEIGNVQTDAQGFYALPYQANGRIDNLEVYALKADGKQIKLETSTSTIGPHEVLDIVVPGALQPLDVEYRRLASDLKPHVGEMANLAKAKENAERQDLSVLHRSTRWDARLIALAATAEQLRGGAEVGLPGEALYGLLRAGLPSDKLLLAQVGEGVVEQALKTARNASVIAMSDLEIAQVKAQYTVFADKVRLNIPAPGSLSTYGELLKASGLPADAQAKFARTYLSQRGDATQLWDSARGQGLNEAQIGKLQLQGKLAFLAGNSAPVTAHLMSKKINDPAELVDLGFHEAESWKTELKSLAGNDEQKLAALIPTVYVADKVQDRLDAYAEDMARKVRISYPTQVIGNEIAKNDQDPFKLGDARKDTATLLLNASKQGFRLGATPVSAFLEKHSGVRAGMTDAVFEQTTLEVRKLQRVYQITPDDESMKVLLSLGLDSAYDVVAVSEDVFLELYGEKFSTLEQARLVYRKAKQVTSVTYNVFAIAKTLESAPAIHGVSAPADVRENVRNELIKHFPTMESLFGSMDYCECEHCRSVLSPAAYLVDLLQFVDTEPEVWNNFLVRWEKSHKEAYSSKYQKPYDALIARRPDLPYIMLTCENTNTVLPYIDVVNEILEYYVANERLTEDAAHNTGDATKEELLAEPQHVIREAYDKIREARYPLTLPFDLPLETVRRFCAYFEMPLSQVLEAFRPGDELFKPAQAYDRASVFVESLGLSPAEWAVLTDPDPLAGDGWLALYGYPMLRPAIAAPTNAGHATLTIDDTAARAFRVGHVCTYFDTSAGKLHTESKTISETGAAGSGGAGRTKVTFEGIWSTAPVAGDLLVIDALGALASAKVLSRRLDITYKELVEIVTSAFVNPELAKLTVMYKLGVSIGDLQVARDPQNRALHAANKDLLGKERADLSVADKKRYDALAQDDWEAIKEVDAFETRLNEFVSTSMTSKADVEAALAAIPFQKILVLADPDAGCNFDLTTLRYADGKPADAIAFLRINLFVRLWRALGWSIEESDRALQAFVPRNALYEPANLNKQPLKTALIYLAHLKALDETLRAGAQSRRALATLWTDIETRGKNPLYAQLFLTRGALKTDNIFDHPLGEYLSLQWLTKAAQLRWHRVQLANVSPGDMIDPAAFTDEAKLKLEYDAVQEVQHLAYEGILSNAKKAALIQLSPSPALPKLLDAVQQKAKDYTLLSGHLLTLQGALDLSANDIGFILEDAGLSLAAAELSLPNVSLLYRYGLLAKTLKLTVRELIALKQLSGVDPFTPLLPDPITTLEEDHPYLQTLEFVKIVAAAKASGLTLDDLNYLLRHRFDPVGPYRLDDAASLQLLRTLSHGLRTIRAEHAIPDDPGTLTDEVLRQKLSLVLPADVTERFLGMLNGTAEFTARKTGVAKTDALDPRDFADEPLIRHVNYQEVPNKEQVLTWRGVLSDDQKASLQARFGPKLNAARKQVFAELLSGIQQSARDFFDTFLAKPVAPDPAATGFLDPADYRLLFDPGLPLEVNETEQERASKRRATLAKAFLPFLQQQLIRQLIVQTVTADADADPALIESLLTDARLLSIVQSTGQTRTLLDILSDTADRGVTLSFFASVDGTGNPSDSVSLADADTTLTNKPTGTKSAQLDGYLEVPAPGAYRFLVVLGKQNAEAVLHFAHLPEPTLNGKAAKDGDIVGEGAGEYVELEPGIPYRFTLHLNALNGGDARVLVQGETLPKGMLSRLTLSPLRTVEDARRALVLLAKVLQIVLALRLTEREVRYLLANAADFSGLDFKKLPTRAGDDSLPTAEALFKQFLRLAAYAHLKQQVAGGTDDLIAVFEAHRAGGPEAVYPLIATLTRRPEATIAATARSLFGESPAFNSEQPLDRLWDALRVVEQFGVPVTSLASWTRIVGPGLSDEERFEIARDLRETVKVRFDAETWLRVAQPNFDKLRSRQRDALVAYVMHQRGFATTEQLYEYFLIDPGMEPVVQTSRIRLAISTVQLFVQRCLLNLEANVHPSAIINAQQWEWMKRYRVWEANRKIFLYPENWLEPEFRDDKTHLFSELEGTLLQDDVSSDLVEDAFLTYLRKLEELARLDIVAMHLEQKDDPANNTLHVIGRTFSQPRKYFYRRYAHQTWTPWEPVNVNIEGDHLAPVIWRDRLYLFWVTFLTRAQQDTAFPIDTSKPIQIAGITLMLEAQLHWSEYVQGEWSTRESSEHEPPDSSKLTEDWVDPRTISIHVSKDPPTPDGDDRGVTVHLGGGFQQAFYLAGRNSSPEKGTYSAPPQNPFSPNIRQATQYAGFGKLSVTYTKKIITGPGKVSPAETEVILDTLPNFTLLPCDNAISLTPPSAASLNAIDPAKVAKAIASGLGEISTLVMPVFYQDNANTFFVEPSAAERTIEDWQEWVTHTTQPETEWELADWWHELEVIPEIPYKVPFPTPDGDPWSDVIERESLDWLINPATVLMFDDQVIGPGGRAGLEILTTMEATDVLENSGTFVNVHAGSGVVAGNVVVRAGAGAFENSGLTAPRSGLNIVGDAGLNSGLQQNVDAFARSRNGGLGMMAGH